MVKYEYDENEEVTTLLKHDAKNETPPSTSTTPDKQVTKPYLPPSIFLIVSNEFCERFTFYGIKAVLIIYLTSKLKMDHSTATAVYHSFNVVCYFSPILGACIADGWLGRYKTILYMSIIYMVGNIVMSLTAIPALGAPEIPGPMIGLLIIAIATGGIKPNISAFGGDQFKPDNLKYREIFFSLFYFFINMGAMFSTLITPILRSRVSCFGDVTCYSLAFGVPSMLMLISIVVFILGTPLYIRSPPKGDIISRFVGCVKYAVVKKYRTAKSLRTETHWLNYAIGVYEEREINDFKAAMKAMFIFVPLPVFWCLLDQQGSTWTLQAESMSGHLGAITLEPDQIQVMNPILILMLIPLFDFVIYPFLAKWNMLTTPLQRIGTGMIIAAISYIVAGGLQLYITSRAVHFPTVGHSALTLSSNIPTTCSISVTWDVKQPPTVLTGSMQLHRAIITSNQYDFKVKPKGKHCAMKPTTFKHNLTSGVSYTLFLYSNNNQNISEHFYVTARAKAKNGLADSRFSMALPPTMDTRNITVHIYDSYGKQVYLAKLLNDMTPSKYKLLHPKIKYKLEIKQTFNQNTSVLHHSQYTVDNGASYTEILMYGGNGYYLHRLVDIQANQVNMLWQIPQYVLIESGEILISVTGLAFAYSQAPLSMKSLVMAGWLVSVGVGDFIVVLWAVIVEIEKKSGSYHEIPSVKFFIFSGMMMVTTVLFAFFARNYNYVGHGEFERLQEEEERREVTEEGKVRELGEKEE
ncbi:solute carrier family 15 member 2-like [Ciona intestinalis]